MKITLGNNRSFIGVSCLFIIIFSCTNNSDSIKKRQNSTTSISTKHVLTKPPSTLQDTLTIKSAVAVFYYPDSSQLIKIKEQSDSVFYKGSMHEYFYQMKTARTGIRNSWPWLTIIESKNYRYLFFIKQDGSGDYIDLNSKNDPYGLFIFDGKKAPRPVDMTNLETIISFYLKE